MSLVYSFAKRARLSLKLLDKRVKVHVALLAVFSIIIIVLEVVITLATQVIKSFKDHNAKQSFTDGNKTNFSYKYTKLFSVSFIGLQK